MKKHIKPCVSFSCSNSLHIFNMMSPLRQLLLILLLIKGSMVLAQHGIGTNNANPDAVLDVAAADKGVLLPRIFLTSASVLAPITGTASDSHNGMIVYNTNTTIDLGLIGSGYYFWDGGASGSWNHIISIPSAFNPNDFLLWNGNNWEPSTPTANNTIFSIWAEESAALGNNLFEWAFGNGDDAPITQGIPIPVSGELFAVGVSLVGATSSTINVLINGAVVATTNPYTGTGSAITTLLTPVSVTPGDFINFQTNAAGGANEGKVVAWFRAKAISPFYLGELSDVSNSTASLQNIIRWDGTQWAADVADGAFVDFIDNLLDVETINSPGFPGELLRWNGAIWTSDGSGTSARISNALIPNFNASTAFIDIPLSLIDYNEFNTSVAIDNTGFLIQQAGTYSISYSGTLISGGARATVITRINAGGNFGGQDFVYLRNDGTVNEGAASGSFTVQLIAGDTVRLQSRREGTITNSVTPNNIADVNMSIIRVN